LSLLEQEKEMKGLTIACTTSFKQQLAKIRRAAKQPCTEVFVIINDTIECFCARDGVNLVHTDNPVTIKRQLAKARELVAQGIRVVVLINNLDEMLTSWIKQIEEKEIN
jgi:hypothetical protein